MNENVAASDRQVVYEFARATTMEGWWTWALMAAALAAIVYLCLRFYRRDVHELSQGVRWTLMLLRLVAIAGLVFFFFDLQRRTQRMVTRPSEVVVLVDTSQSMSLPASTSSSSLSRTERATELLAASDLLKNLSQEHRTSVYAFDQQSEPRLLETRGGVSATATDQSELAAEPPAARSPIALFGVLCAGIAVVIGVAALLIGAAGRGGSVGWLLFTSAVCMVLGLVCLGSVYAVDTGRDLASILAGGANARDARDPSTENEASPDESSPVIRVVDWQQEIAATGSQSRIGDAIRGVLTDHDPTTLAGIILLTDGQNNGGVDPTAAVGSARRNEVAVYPIGLGSSAAPVNVRVVDIDAPKRVYPGDRFAVSAILQASGPKPVTVEVQLIDGLDDSRQQANGDQRDQKTPDGGSAEQSGGDPGNANTGPSTEPAAGNRSDQQIEVGGDFVDSTQVTIANDGTLSTIRFELEPESVGRRRLAIRVVAPAEDRNTRDDVRDARYEVVAKKLKVLLVAGGPTREYRFVRNLLFRDNSIELDVLLQTGQPGISQDADQVRADFPDTAEDLFQYDVLAMFDPDWMAIDSSSLDLLDRWLTQQAGGMILVAGPVYHPRWTQTRTDPRVSRIAGFFPVNVATRGPLFGGGREGGDTAWPLEFTPEARRAEFLWIDDDPESSAEIWAEFPGVYDYVGVKDAKPASKVYAYFSDPTTDVGGSLPVYLASQFYGAGRVYFQGSGEMWRLRGLDDAYFDKYYTKLVRWVSEGRLLRDSNRGILLVDSSRAMVGDMITVRAVLTDEQFEPLDVADVEAKLLTPGGQIDSVRLLPLQGEPRAGTYGGRFNVREAGSYELRLALGDVLNEQVLRQTVQVRLPTVELERPRRNDEELSQLASSTSGVFFPLDDQVSVASVATELTSTIRAQPQTTVLPGTPDRDFGERRNAVLMWLLASVLTFEWITRRLHRLA